MSPKISVIIPVHNGEKYLKETLESIIHQTFRDFELLVIDDGSTDRSLQIINDYAKTDDRITVYQNIENKGIAFTTNFGIGQAKGNFIAVSDQDDISFPERLERQIKYFEQHPEIHVLGAQIINTDPNLQKPGRVSSFPVTPGAYRWMQLFGCMTINSTVMIRRAVFSEYGFRYGNFKTASDYDMFAKLGPVCKLANYPQPLMYHRRHENAVSIIHSEIQRQELYDIIRFQVLNLIGEELSDNQISGIVLPKHQKKERQIINAQTEWRVSQLLIKLQNQAMKWELTPADRNFIKQNTASRLRRIWREQKYNPLLLPYIFYSLILDPGLIQRRLQRLFQPKPSGNKADKLVGK